LSTGHISGLERPGGGLPVTLVRGIERKPGPAGCRARGDRGAGPPTGPFFLGRLALAGGVA